jgi:hypothetical protein
MNDTFNKDYESRTIEIASNHVGPNGESIDRIYGSPASGGTLRLVNRDYTTYKGAITKKSITSKGIDGNNFRTHVYVTDDNRWFDRAGMPISKDSVKLDKEEVHDATQD